MAKETQAVAKTDTKPPAVIGDQLPDFLKTEKFLAGSDNFDSSDVVIPRVKLLQGLSGECEAFNDAKPGMFWHSGMDISLGEEFSFIIADRRKKFLLSAPIEDGQGVLARCDDAVTWDRLGKWQVKIKGVKNPVTWEITDLDLIKSGLANWGTYVPDDEDSPPAATMFYDYLIFLPDHLDLGPAVLSLARSQIRSAKKGLNDKIKLHAQNGRPMQGLVFKAKSTDDKSESGGFKNLMFHSNGFVQDKKLYDMAIEHAGALANIKIADEAAEETNTERVADDGKSGGF